MPRIVASMARRPILARVDLVTEQQATGRVKEIYEEIKATMGWDMVPQTFQLVAHNPEHLQTYWENYKATMSAGRLDLKTKKLIAYVVSAMNNCGV